MKNRNLRKRSKQSIDTNSWKNKFIDTPVFLIGNGPSLNDEDISYLSNYLTIGINRSFYKIDSTILLWQDASLWFSERDKILKSESIKLCTKHSDPDNRFSHFELKKGDFGIPDSFNTLIGSGSTAPLAVQLSILLGCNPIVLLGFDCKYREDRTDFYGNNRFHNNKTLSQCLSGLLWIKNYVSPMKTIISCSDNCIFERKSVKNVVDNIDVKHKKDFKYWKELLL